MIQRRELLRRAAWLLGGAVSAPAALAILQGCSAREEGAAGAYKPQLLDAGEFAIVDEIAEIMIPRTETSGARDAGVAAFIDTVLAKVYPADAQQRFRTGCAEFAAAAVASDKAFLERDLEDRTAFTRAWLESALAAAADEKPFILMARELTLLGYFTSRVGITENMEYVPVPTAYRGCVPLSQLKKHVYWE
jgi:hypothetical protein